MSGMSRVGEVAVDREAVCREIVEGRFYLADDHCEAWAVTSRGAMLLYSPDWWPEPYTLQPLDALPPQLNEYHSPHEEPVFWDEAVKAARDTLELLEE